MSLHCYEPERSRTPATRVLGKRRIGWRRGPAQPPRCARRCRASARIVLAAIALLAGACSADPGYQGRSSRDWIRVLGDPDADTRADAANALGHVLRLQPRSPAVVDALIGALGDPDDQVRVAAGIALATEGVRAPAALPGLVDVLRDSAHADVRSYAANILGTFGPAALTAAPALTAALNDADAGVRRAAAAALGQIGPAAMSASPTAVPALARLARDPVEHVRLSTIEALLRVQAPLRIVLPVLETALADGTASVRAAAAQALGTLGPAAAPAAPAAARALADAEPSVRAAAASALGAMGPRAAGALGPLTAATRDRDASVAMAAADAVAAVQGRPRPPRPVHEP